MCDVLRSGLDSYLDEFRFLCFLPLLFCSPFSKEKKAILSLLVHTATSEKKGEKENSPDLPR